MDEDYGDFVKKEIISDEEDPLEIDKEHPLQNESAFDNLDIKLEEEDHDIANEANEETMDYV